MTILCYVSGRTDPTQFFYNMMVVFDQIPDLYSLRRSIEQQANEDMLVCDGSEFVVSDVEILDFRLNAWVNLESRSQLYSGCFLTAIRDTMTSTCAGAVDTTHKSNMQRVLGFAVNAQRMFEALDIDGEGVLRLKGFLKVLRHDIHYAVEAMEVLDSDAAGTVTFQQFVTLFHDPLHKSFFNELKERIEHAGRSLRGGAAAGDNGGEDGSGGFEEDGLHEGDAIGLQPSSVSFMRQTSDAKPGSSSEAARREGGRAVTPTSEPDLGQLTSEANASMGHEEFSSMHPKLSIMGRKRSAQRSATAAAAAGAALHSKAPSSKGSRTTSPSSSPQLISAVGRAHSGTFPATEAPAPSGSLRKLSTTLGPITQVKLRGSASPALSTDS